MTFKRGWSIAGLVALLTAVALLVSCSVLAGNEEGVDIKMASATVEVRSGRTYRSVLKFKDRFGIHINMGTVIIFPDLVGRAEL